LLLRRLQTRCCSSSCCLNCHPATHPVTAVLATTAWGFIRDAALAAAVRCVTSAAAARRARGLATDGLGTAEGRCPLGQLPRSLHPESLPLQELRPATTVLLPHLRTTIQPQRIRPLVRFIDPQPQDTSTPGTSACNLWPYCPRCLAQRSYQPLHPATPTICPAQLIIQVVLLLKRFRSTSQSWLSAMPPTQTPPAGCTYVKIHR
jgi:hypothetical protein